jgi:hypothetical protein
MTSMSYLVKGPLLLRVTGHSDPHAIRKQGINREI